MPPPRGSTASDQADPAGSALPSSPCRAPGTSVSLPWSSLGLKGRTAPAHGGASGWAAECRGRGSLKEALSPEDTA